MKHKIIPPQSRLDKFTCPHCGAISGQLWGVLSANNGVSKIRDIQPELAGWLRGSNQWRNIIEQDGDWIMSSCENCAGICVWRNEKLIYPDIIVVEEPNEDLPEDIKKDYQEAASILNKSPRGAAALLRLCVQKLCIYLGKKGKNLNDDIGELAKEGLPEKTVKAMDILRVTGNNYVHPGKLDTNDDAKVATDLFKLLNFIAYKMITEPKEIDSLYEDIVPESAKTATEQRSKRK